MYVKSLVSWLLSVITFVVLKAHVGAPLVWVDPLCAILSLIVLLKGSNSGRLSSMYGTVHMCVWIINLTTTAMLPTYFAGSTLLLLMGALLALAVCVSPFIVEAILEGFLAKDGKSSDQGGRVVQGGALIVVLLFSGLVLLGLVVGSQQTFYLTLAFWILLIAAIIVNSRHAMGFAKH